MKKADFRPRLLCFMCQWCGYSAADLAGTSRIQYPASVRGIEVACSGMVHPEWVVNALLGGLDGVMIFGCHPGQCHYGSGNELALARSEVITEALLDMGIEEERFALVWVAASEARRFAQAVSGMTEKLRQLGPNRVSAPVSIVPGKPLYGMGEYGFVHKVEEKNFYWDGNVYNDHVSAQRAISRYLDNDFEAKLVPCKGKILIYTRKEASGRERQ